MLSTERKTLFWMMLLLLSMALQGAPDASPKEPLREKGPSMKPDQMAAEIDARYQRIGEIEKLVKKMHAEAINEKDIKWKMCLDDILATIRGVVASLQSIRDRMGDLIRAEKYETAQMQLMVARGLTDAAEKAFVDAQACPRQLTRVDNRSTVEKEQKREITGTYGKEDSLGEAMGQDFTSEWATERNPNDLGGDITDGAGTDNPGGPAETPGTSGGVPDSIGDHGDQIAIPPFIEVSPEK